MPAEQGWPDWWDWELYLTPHFLKRMEDRDFNELDPRRMLDLARTLRAAVVEGRWVIEARHQRRVWEVIVEPDELEQCLVVVTVCPVTRSMR